MTLERRKGALDMTQGDPMRLLIRFAIPMLIGSVFQLLYNLVDTMVLGRFVSAQALAAVGATSSTTMLILLLGVALSNAMSVLISQNFGARDERGVHRMMGLSLIVCTGFSLLIAAFAFTCAESLLRLLDTPEDILPGATVYVRVTCGLFVGQMFYNSASSVLRAIGDSRTPLIFLIVCSVLNIVLDISFVFLFGAANGIAAVAWATVLSQIISAVCSCVYMWRKYPLLHFERANLRPEADTVRRFFRIALPMLLQNLLITVGQLVITRVVNGFGTNTVAAYTVCGKVEQIVTVLISQVAFSFSVYSGQNFGAKKYARIRQGVRKALVLLGVLTGISMLVLALLGRPLVLMFVEAKEQEIISAALEIVRVYSVTLPLLAAIWLYSSALRGMGMVRPTLMSSILELCSKIGFSIALSMLMGRFGIWLASPLGWAIGLAPLLWHFYMSHWDQKLMEAENAV